MDRRTGGISSTEREAREREREREGERERESATGSSSLLSSLLAVTRMERRDRAGRTAEADQAKIGDHEQGEEREREREKTPSRVPLPPRGPPGTRRVIYISPRTYLPTRGADSAKVYGLFYDTRKRGTRGGGPERGQEGPGEGSGRFFPSPSAILPFSPA